MLLLDEPTTFLDLKVQVDLMALLSRIVQEDGRTMLLVLHELNFVAAFADRIVAEGTNSEVIHSSALQSVFDLQSDVFLDPLTNRPVCLPRTPEHAQKTRVAAMWHISVGAKIIPITVVWDAITTPQSDLFDHLVIRDVRLPRAIFAMTVRAALSVAGALMQGVLRNPLAEPAMLGLMSGATFAVVIGIGWLGLASSAYVPVFAAGGALIGAVMVWSIAGAAFGGATPLTLILSDAAARTLVAPIEISTGLLTTMLDAPFFIILIRAQL